MAAELHLYQCWVCKSTLTVTVKSAGTGEPYRCLNDRTPMTFMFSQPIVTEDDRALADRVPVFNQHVARMPCTLRPCDACRRRVERAGMIELSGVGKFCSDACASVGSEQHAALLQRVAKVKEEMPWLT